MAIQKLWVELFVGYWSPVGTNIVLVKTIIGNDKAGILNIGNRDIWSDNVNNAVYTHEIILRVKPDLFCQLK